MIIGKKIFFLLLAICSFNFIYSQDAGKLTQGEKLFKENKPKDAVQVLENELLNGIVTANTYNFLGLGYYQLGEYGKSIDAFDRGIKAQPTNIKILSFNQGNTYYAMKDFSSAVRCFTSALNDDATFYDALLNRANSLLMANQLPAAKSDYEDFVLKCPDDAQKSQIERLIQALADEIARREEEERLLREQNKAMWEEFDPSITETVAEEIQWEKINADIDETEDSDRTEWENIDASIEEQKVTKKSVDWEDVNTTIAEYNVVPKKIDWEKVEQGNTQLTTAENENKDEKVRNEQSSEEKNKSQLDWEKLDTDKIAKLQDYDLILDEDGDYVPDWQNLSEEEALELKRLEKESRLEYEKWLEEQSLMRQKKAEEELRKLQQKSDEERLAREKLLEDVMKAEEARRKKLLDDVANSLQNGNSTNISSGTEDLINYDLEGELD